MKKIGVFSVVFACFVVAEMFLLSAATELMSMRTDLGVVCGVFLLVLGLSSFIWVLYMGVSTMIRSKVVQGFFKNNIKVFLPVMLLLFSGFSCTKIEPGYAGIKVNLYGSQKGVEDFPLRVGRVWFNPFTENVYKFPTFLQTIVWTKDETEGSPNDDSITFNSTEGAIINADISLSYGFIEEKVPYLFIEFRKDADEITKVYTRSKVRDAFSRSASMMKVVDIFGVKKQELLNAVKTNLEKELSPKGFRFDMISFVGALRVDENVSKSISATIQATQRAIEAENKVRQATAEADQKIETARGTAESLLIVAKAQAEANKIVAASVTGELIQWQATKQWNGVLPQVTGSGSIPMVNLGK